jgi:hypothetical protein
MRVRTRPLVSGALCVAAALLGSGCAFGPRSLERSQLLYNEAIKSTDDEQQLLNLVRLRYIDTPMTIDVSSVASQYELSGGLEARPFFSTEGVNLTPPNGPFKSFTSLLPSANVGATTRPTIAMTPLNDSENIRNLFQPNTLDGIIFMSETSWPVSTVFRLWVEYLNEVPNAPSASGPARGPAPAFERYLRVMQLFQELQDIDKMRFVRLETITELGSPLPTDAVNAATMVEAAKNGLEYRQNNDRTWTLIKKDRRLVLRFHSSVIDSPLVKELCTLLNLKPEQTQYDVTVGVPPLQTPKEGAVPESRLNIFPRSTVQALFYLSKGVEIPLEHYARGYVHPTTGQDGSPFDWQQLTGDFFTVHSVKQRCRPDCAYVAVKYRDYWYYIDDRDNESKIAFTHMSAMVRLNMLSSKKGGPTLTLPVGR